MSGRTSIAEWVRQALIPARRSEPSREVAAKLKVIRAAARMNFPTGEIGRMLEEIGSSRASPTKGNGAAGTHSLERH